MNNIHYFFNNIIGDVMNYLYPEYTATRSIFEDDFADCSDFLLREIVINNRRAFVCVMDGLVESLQLNQMIMAPIMTSKNDASTPKEYMAELKESVIRSVEMNDAKTFDDCYYFLMSGFAIFFLDGCDTALALGIQGWTKRDTNEPTNEAMVKGAKECFVETLNDNKALLRKRLKTHHLKLKQIKIGSATSTPVAIAYIDNRADKALVKKIENRLNNAQINALLDFGSVNACLDTDVASLFSAVGNTERPDTLASKLLEGRVAVMVEGTPYVMYTPYLFSDNFSAFDDYENPPLYSSFMRGLRYFAFFISLLLPGVYVAVGTFHQELIPTTLLYIVATSEATTPFPLMIEAIMIHLLYEIMREAGLRLPVSIGHAVSIIGAIVIGDATVSAGLIGAPMLVVVAVTAIASYVVYPLYESVAVLRILFILIGGMTGMYGLMLGFGVLLLNICVLNPFGVPYSAPISPLTRRSLGDTLFFKGWKRLFNHRVRVNDLEGASVE